MKKRSWQIDIEDYAPLIGEEAVERIMHKAHRLRGMRVLHVSSTFYGGGVAELLSSETLLAASLGLRADWRLIQGSPDFFNVTKKIHNALQGGEINLTELKKDIYEEVNVQNAVRMKLDADFVVVHDPQPLPLILHERHTCPWVWRCHVDLSHPNPEMWSYLRPFIDEYDAVVLSLPEYGQEVFESLLGHQEERVMILTAEDSALVNALQRHAAVVLQKSLREGFGLTATEAMWKGAAVIAGRCGGLMHQVEDGVNGYLVSSVEEAARRMVELVRDDTPRRKLGGKARETVRERFLMSRKIEQYLDLFAAFEPTFALNHRRAPALKTPTR